MGKKRLGIGIENYKEMHDKQYYYVDKTLMLKELLDQGGKVTLFTRPRRFGKTLALSMLRTFFEQELNENGEMVDNRHYFAGTKILEAGEEYQKQMGKYPVISLSLKSAKQPDFDMAYSCLLDEIRKEYERHYYVLLGDALLPSNKERYQHIMEGKANAADYAKSLAFLSDCLKKYHKANVIILMDEYDVPLENAYVRGFYEPMTDFIRSLFESSLKTNDSLEFAVVTGCLRISRESIFTGLNNLEVISILEAEHAEYYGFTEEETEKFLDEYQIIHKLPEVKKWYNGYLFGKTKVYNPWSVLNYIKTAVLEKQAFPQPYWVNTSSNSIIRKMAEMADTEAKKEIEALIAGGTIEKPVYPDITYEDVYKSQDNLWNFLFFTGYLTMVSKRMEDEMVYLTLAIPNAEVRYLYRNTIREWFEQQVKKGDFQRFYQNLQAGNAEEISDFITSQLMVSISYHDNAEAFYHGYLVGILGAISGYEIESNKEQGDGRPDIVLKPFTPKKPAIILELKRAEKFTGMDAQCNAALMQIEEKHYDAGLFEEGYQTILKYGICFCKKNCMVKGI